MGAAGSSGTCCWDTEAIDGGSNGFPLGRAQLMGGRAKERVEEGFV